MRLFDSRWNGMHGIGRFSTELEKRTKGFSKVELLGAPHAALDPLKLTGFLRTRKPEFYFSPGFNAPIGTPCRFGFTVHDLNHLYVRENRSVLKSAYYRHIIRPAILRADVLFTVSEFSRTQILEWSGVSPNNIVVIRQGISEAFCVTGQPEVSRVPYFLFVGSDRPHKNLARIVAAFAASKISEDTEFVITGSVRPELLARISRLGVERRIRVLGGVSDARLASLYRGSICLVFASLYEGFGLPIIEAMACGTPVLTAEIASLPEVAGDAALYVSPVDVEQIGAGLERMCCDADFRNELKMRGLKRTKLYDWDLAAEVVQSEIEKRLGR